MRRRRKLKVDGLHLSQLLAIDLLRNSIEHTRQNFYS